MSSASVRQGRVDPPIPLVLYTRRHCHLCDAMKAEIARARSSRPVALREVDVDGDPELAARHGMAIPVLEIAGRVAFRGRLRASELERELARIAPER